MLKILFYTILFYLLYKMLLRLLGRAVRPSSTSKRPANQVEASELIKCDQCGLYVARHEAIRDETKYFCSSECHQRSKNL